MNTALWLLVKVSAKTVEFVSPGGAVDVTVSSAMGMVGICRPWEEGPGTTPLRSRDSAARAIPVPFRN